MRIVSRGTALSLTASALAAPLETVLYNFCLLPNCSDGADPNASLIADNQGALYGTTYNGGTAIGGTVFKLTPPAKGQTAWAEAVLYSFASSTDDSGPLFAGVIADRRGALCARRPDGNAFRAYVSQILAPELTPGDAVIIDNLPARKVHGVRQAIDAAGAMVLYLPAYSPDFNPIEMAFSNSPRAFPPSCTCWNLKPAPIKALLRAAAARTTPDLGEAIRIALNAFTRSECQNYFAAAGYDAI
jgi:uncharacterized repeat protein (TIGR03803 family)